MDFWCYRHLFLRNRLGIHIFSNGLEKLVIIVFFLLRGVYRLLHNLPSRVFNNSMYKFQFNSSSINQIAEFIIQLILTFSLEFEVLELFDTT